MLIALTVMWLGLPIAPLNPIEEDTLAAMNFHVAAGMTTPNGVLPMLPEVTFKYEALILHPLIARASLDYQYGHLKSKVLPRGSLHQGTLSLVALCYRGTDKLTGYIGLGPIARFGHVSLASAERNAGWSYEGLTVDQIADADLKPGFGYRLIFGLRYRKTFSLEVIISEVSTNFVYHRRDGPDSYSIFEQEADLGSLRISLGYVWTLKEFW
jgi:hypothetical protein